MWSARVRRFNEAEWHYGVAANISITGALLEINWPCDVGEWLAVEIKFHGTLRQDGVLARCGEVIRKAHANAVAVRFVLASPALLATSARKSCN